MVSVNAELTELITQDRLDFEGWLARLPVSFGEPETAALADAWRLAREGYAGAVRASGEAYFTHVLAVASILAELRLDAESLVAAFLHDLAPLGLYDREAIEKRFGADVVSLVEGVARMEVIHDLHDRPDVANPEAAQAESLRKMLLAMARDVRVVFIALAERLDDMRSLKNLPEEQRVRIARETQDLYAPLANRLGIWQLKWELEDLSFRYLEPEAYKRIAKLLAERRVDREDYIARVKAELGTALARAGIEADIAGRPKHLYSIWKKMQRKGIDFHELFDIRAVRLLVKDIASCYAALGVAHGLWRHIPKEFDDYIATPKENNYRSLHTAVVGPEGRTLEVQIRTQEMHQQAELGIAAHWRYKEGGPQDRAFEQKIAWLRQVLEWGQEEGEDFIDRFKAELFEDRVYVISPKGDVLDLPCGATPLDYAYYVHSDIGNRCRGAKVDGRIVPLTYELQNGEQVEILTTRNGTPSRDWLNPSIGYLKTARARGKVRAYFRALDHDKNVSAGRQALERELQRLGLHDVNLDRLAQKTRYPKLEDFLAAIGRNDVTSGQIGSLLNDHILPPEPDKVVTTAPAKSTESGDVSIHGVGNLLSRTARCCKPAPGDTVIGFITRGQGITIHRRDCANLRRLQELHSDRLVEVNWNRSDGRAYPVDIQVDAVDRQGLLRDISGVLSNEKINVIGVNTHTDTKTQQARMTLTVEISDLGQISRVMDRIGKVLNVLDVRRRD